MILKINYNILSLISNNIKHAFKCHIILSNILKFEYLNKQNLFMFKFLTTLNYLIDLDHFLYSYSIDS